MLLLQEQKKYYEDRIQTTFQSLRKKRDLRATVGLTDCYTNLGKLELYENRDSATLAKKTFLRQQELGNFMSGTAGICIYRSMLI